MEGRATEQNGETGGWREEVSRKLKALFGFAKVEVPVSHSQVKKAEGKCLSVKKRPGVEIQI